jgi:hypothetical protein
MSSQWATGKTGRIGRYAYRPENEVIFSPRTWISSARVSNDAEPAVQPERQRRRRWCPSRVARRRPVNGVTLGIMKAIATLLALIVLTARAAEPTSASAMLLLIEGRGARGAVDKLWNTEGWQQLRLGVASGAADWPEVAEKIRPGTDAGATSELMDVVAWALPKAPERVLSLIAHDPERWMLICHGPPVDEPPEGYSIYYRNAIAGVGRVDHVHLLKVKATCLPLLEAAAKEVSK